MHPFDIIYLVARTQQATADAHIGPRQSPDLREAGKPACLQLPERLAQAYPERLGGRQVPPWDFGATGDDPRTKDTADAAVVASALIEMARIHPNPDAGAGWIAASDGCCVALKRTKRLVMDGAKRLVDAPFRRQAGALTQVSGGAPSGNGRRRRKFA